MDVQEVFKCYGITPASSGGALAMANREETRGKGMQLTDEANQEESQQTRSFAEVAASNEKQPILIQSSLQRLEGGNIVVDIDEGEYLKGVRENQFSIIGRLILQNRMLCRQR